MTIKKCLGIFKIIKLLNGYMVIWLMIINDHKMTAKPDDPDTLCYGAGYE